MRFQVPQFTDVEDKIVGPLTLKQFIYLAGAGGACVVAYSFLPIIIALPLMLGLALLGAALAFYKVNNRPFIRVVESYLTYKIKEKLYIWKHDQKKPGAADAAAMSANRSQVFVPKLSQSRLRDLTWSLDVKGNSNPVTGVSDDDRDRLL